MIIRDIHPDIVVYYVTENLCNLIIGLVYILFCVTTHGERLTFISCIGRVIQSTLLLCTYTTHALFLLST